MYCRWLDTFHIHMHSKIQIMHPVGTGVVDYGHKYETCYASLDRILTEVLRSKAGRVI